MDKQLVLLAGWQSAMHCSHVISQCSGEHFYGKQRDHLHIYYIPLRDKPVFFKGIRGNTLASVCHMRKGENIKQCI